jgi:hypothetical protein
MQEKEPRVNHAVQEKEPHGNRVGVLFWGKCPDKAWHGTSKAEAGRCKQRTHSWIDCLKPTLGEQTQRKFGTPLFVVADSDSES